ncbi:hypothetical protein SATRM34S_03736 [Streptomyces atroolivaceus]
MAPTRPGYAPGAPAADDVAGILARGRPTAGYRHPGHGAGPASEGRPGPLVHPCSAYFSLVPEERRLVQASVTRTAMPASADLPQLRGS